MPSPPPEHVTNHQSLEPISYTGTCATEARWDAVLGGSRRRIDSMLGATDNEMRPDRPVPFGVAARTVVCIVALLDNIDILPSSGALHTVRPGHNASRAWL